MLASVGIGHQNSPLFAMYLSEPPFCNVSADEGGYTISVPIKMRYLSDRSDPSDLFQMAPTLQHPCHDVLGPPLPVDALPTRHERRCRTPMALLQHQCCDVLGPPLPVDALPPRHEHRRRRPMAPMLQHLCRERRGEIDL